MLGPNMLALNICWHTAMFAQWEIPQWPVNASVYSQTAFPSSKLCLVVFLG